MSQQRLNLKVRGGWGGFPSTPRLRTFLSRNGPHPGLTVVRLRLYNDRFHFININTKDMSKRLCSVYCNLLFAKKSQPAYTKSFTDCFFGYKINLQPDLLPSLKGQSNNIFYCQFFHHSNLSGPLTNGLSYFQFSLRFPWVILTLV